MPEEIKVLVEGVSRYCDCLTPEMTTTSSPGSCDGKNARNPGHNKALIPKCISDKLFTVGAVVVIAALIIIIISLAVKKTETCLPCRPLVSVACPDSWIRYHGKCLYVSKEERNWSLSLTTCSSFNASLAVIDTQKELDFWVDIFRSSHYWFGLSRKVNQIWKWSNGTEFKNQFPVRGEGFCAYLNGKGASSTICSMEKRFLCSRPESYNKAGMKGSSWLGEIWGGRAEQYGH
ncbi:C-type lectin domain family 2 member D-like [Pantherophis guttatus]|uniref:C-type lectin domain family 2 member D-like n=1 Tax=Pantherophis guttatus TaxID=94885 RepID=A0A6P9C1Z9_PANGU|nr:C-type lectin domain family 2 member D-like [Pantherophis guttatus]XP_034277484.1 C-type lectin domain family 2 member D-like [Pantherophis guttatus]XP_034277485.1 C-type lectin domain family 2 member D-like [Pantherophis guttatus]XP_034277486.1 C-type lectin domain family 2 member D-like [Pantherophis guttatus]XP_034277487.1 C-type lectin domain family 2 member D-like [Pantherophis guttatus]XP_060547091.1 C-type lectin domain family 2 member D-like [Pantherophis guttatus]XP_060547092.1 C-